MKRYSFLRLFVTVNIFLGIALFLMIMSEGLYVINHLGYLKRFGRDESGSIFTSYLFLAVVFFIIFEVIAYFLHRLRLMGLEAEAEAQHQQLVTLAEASPIKIPALTNKTGLKVTGYSLNILGLLLAFMSIPLIFDLFPDRDYVCDFDCGMYQLTPPDYPSWILFATMSYVATFIVLGFTIGASCLAVYRMKQVSEYPLPPQSNMPTIVISDKKSILFQLLAFLGILFGGMILVFGTILQIIRIADDISHSSRYSGLDWGILFEYVLMTNAIWLGGFGVLGIGLIFYYVGDIRQYIRAKRGILAS